MSRLQLFAVTDSGPLPLPVPDTAERFEDLYHDLEGVELGVYSSFRTFEQNKFLCLGEHLRRTERSSQKLNCYSFDQKRLRNALHIVCTASATAEMRVRIDILARPISVAGHRTRELIALMPFTPPPDTLYEKGVWVATVAGLTRENPLIKSADFVEERQKYLDSREKIYEQLLVNNRGEILEGFSSNFYGVIDGKFYTAAEGVLEGITRRIIIDLFAKLEIPVIFRPVRVVEIERLQEAAISSSSRGLMPVVGIDDIVIGDGKPGPLCQRILDSYRHFVASNIQHAL